MDEDTHGDHDVLRMSRQMKPDADDTSATTHGQSSTFMHPFKARNNALG